jgi:hypothetical protein
MALPLVTTKGVLARQQATIVPLRLLQQGMALTTHRPQPIGLNELDSVVLHTIAFDIAP